MIRAVAPERRARNRLVPGQGVGPPGEFLDDERHAAGALVYKLDVTGRARGPGLKAAVGGNDFEERCGVIELNLMPPIQLWRADAIIPGADRRIND